MNPVYGAFLKSDTLCLPVVKRRDLEQTSERLAACADSACEIEIPFEIDPAPRKDEKSVLQVFSFKISKWFEEFEFVDSEEKCLAFLKRAGLSGNGRGKWDDHSEREFKAFKGYDWSKPLVFMISDRLLICDILRIMDGRFSRIDPISSDGSIYTTRTLWYIFQQSIIFNRRPNVIKNRGYCDEHDSPIHTMSYHYGFNKCVNFFLGHVGYSPRNIVELLLLEKFSIYDNMIKTARQAINDAESGRLALEKIIPELELRLTCAGF